MLKLLLFILFAYLIGSLSAAIIISKLFGLPDPRSEGSKNPGATNVLRLGGKKIAIIVLFGDFLKGLIPVLLATAFGLPPISLAWVGLAAVLGHIFPLYFGFKGGKGVATGAGVFFALSWKLGVLTFFTWIVIAALFQYSSLAAIVGSIVAPFYTFWLLPECIIPVGLMCILLLWRHAENFKRLLAGEEDKISKSKRDKDNKQKHHKHYKQKEHKHFKPQHYKKSTQSNAKQ
jgi:glycerol-3-phosphate acyltransferase PlsY